MIEYNKRIPILGKPSEFYKLHPDKLRQLLEDNPKLSVYDFETSQADDWYDYLINDYIVNQPDSEELMEMFIESGFDPLVFCCKLNPTAKNIMRLESLNNSRKADE